MYSRTVSRLLQWLGCGVHSVKTRARSIRQFPSSNTTRISSENVKIVEDRARTRPSALDLMVDDVDGVQLVTHRG